MLRGLLQRRGLIVHKFQSSSLSRCPHFKQQISALNIFKRWIHLTGGSNTTVLRSCRWFSSNPLVKVLPTLDSRFTHKYNAWYFYAIPIFFWSLGDFVYLLNEETAIYSWSGGGSHTWRALFLSALFGGAAHTESACLLNATALTNLINRPLIGMASMAGRVFARGYLTALFLMAAWSVFFTCLSLQAKSKKTNSEDMPNVLIELIRKTWQTGEAIFVSAFPIYFVSAMFGAPIFYLVNRGHWARQIARLAGGNKIGL